MNWKEINDRYPKALLELFRNTIDSDASIISEIQLDWISVKYGSRGYGDFPTSMLEDYLLFMPQYFDEFGIIILPEYHIAEKVFSSLIVDAVSKKRISIVTTSSKREDVLVVAIKYAFQIREKQLTQ